MTPVLSTYEIVRVANTKGKEYLMDKYNLSLEDIDAAYKKQVVIIQKKPRWPWFKGGV